VKKAFFFQPWVLKDLTVFIIIILFLLFSSFSSFSSPHGHPGKSQKKKFKLCLLYLPGHSFRLQLAICWLTPTHCLPPWAGAGLLHVLYRFLVPSPHDSEHCSYSDHCE